MRTRFFEMLAHKCAPYVTAIYSELHSCLVKGSIMTKRRLYRITMMVIGVYTVAILLGGVIRICDARQDLAIYSTYKDLLPLIIAIPAAYLAYSFQRRSSYVQALRAYWSLLVRAVQGAYGYTLSNQPTYEQWSRVLIDLGVAIDEARGVFNNLPVPGKPEGWYPFEPIKEIYRDIQFVRYGADVTDVQLRDLHERIDERWRLVRAELLREFDRDVPTFHFAWYTRLAGAAKDQQQARGLSNA